MPLTITDATAQLNNFFDTIQSNVETKSPQRRCRSLES